MSIPNTVNIYDLIQTSPKPDVAGILASAAYALRESTTFLAAWSELGFDGIDTKLLKDIECDRQLTLVSLACVTQLSIQVQTND